MEPFRLRLGDLPEEETARRAAFVLRKGGIALLPAEGVYGFHVSAASASAVARIQALKGRAGRAGFIGLVAHPEDVARWARLDAAAERLVREYWPGALTLVLDALPEVPPALRSTDGTIALRCPGSSFLRAVVRTLDAGPLLSTSANAIGVAPAGTLDDAPPGFADLVVDGGALSGAPSTLVRVSAAGIEVLRAGAIAIQNEP